MPANDKVQPTTAPADQGGGDAVQLERSTYEILQQRLQAAGEELRGRISALNQSRREVFGAIATELLSTQQTATPHNCIARDMAAIGDHFIFGYNVHFGLKSETHLEDVFAIYQFDQLAFHERDLSGLQDARFLLEFQQLYKYYKQTQFLKFHLRGPHLYMVFQVGKTVADVKVFKWQIVGNQLQYIDNRSEHEVKQPQQHDYQWKRTHRDFHRAGRHPHISIEDLLFVETVGGDLTIKVEDNTEDGRGIYAEPVNEADQTLDDAEIFYALAGNLVLLKIRPFRENAFRYFVFNRKNNHVLRQDSIGRACVALPDEQGIIFSQGFYTQSGQFKVFENLTGDLAFERKIASANGEDYLYVFHQAETGEYLLLPYNVIEQRIATPVVCNGFCLFDNGHLLYFRAEPAPQKHHAIQVWQTPFVGPSFIGAARTDSMLFKIGNKSIVRGIADCQEILNLVGKDDSFADRYVDLVRKAQSVLDGYFWLKEEKAFRLSESLEKIKVASAAAVDEFDKVKRIRANTKRHFDEVNQATSKLLTELGRRKFPTTHDFVNALAELRTTRGKVISLRELQYVDLNAIERLEQELIALSEKLSRNCAEFLAQPTSMNPYREEIDRERAAIEQVTTVQKSKELDKRLAAIGGQLELLIEIISNLKIEDATQRAEIIDRISTLYAALNQTRALQKNKTRELFAVEGAAEFAAQLKLLSQAVTGYLDVSDTPERCDEYLTRMMVQIEELEGRFAEFDEFTVQLAEKRDEIYAAFDVRKVQIQETRNRRAAALQAAAERILKGIHSRVTTLPSLDEINSYFASDLMVEKVRDIVRELTEMSESVKVDEIQSRLKTVREEAARQLRDRQDLFVDGRNLIRLGSHQFSVNTQPLDLTMIAKDGALYFHLTGTNFLEAIENETLNGGKQFWDQALISENRDVYRAEYLAWLLFQSNREPKTPLLEFVQTEMATRYSEGYLKGVHDHDAALILEQLYRLKERLGMMRTPASHRAFANAAWWYLAKYRGDTAEVLRNQVNATRRSQEWFGIEVGRERILNALSEALGAAQRELGVATSSVASAAEFLYEQLIHDRWVVEEQTQRLAQDFWGRLPADARHRGAAELASIPPAAAWATVNEWLRAFVQQQALAISTELCAEAASVILDGSLDQRQAMPGNPRVEIADLLGEHPRLQQKPYVLDYGEFVDRLRHFEGVTIPGYAAFHQAKSDCLHERREALRLEEFKPKVLTSFVRNRLIDQVYLPLIGNNLAKQMGAAGEQKRTDLMGLLLLISPPGYGKTTLMEYVANRLGLTFVKINGPALGHHVTSLDPQEAPNVSAREEILRLNLALEMGDNVMIYVDDIQHTHPEFLQKFISLCDAQRKIEGVFRGRPRTYDLRGRKVCVVMAGNPYTESGEKFQIPDMLANRADTYNLGDVIGGNQSLFELSYLENCVTSNPVLARLVSRGWDDFYQVIKVAESDGQIDLSLGGSYSMEEINEFVNLVKKLLVVRSQLLRVNRQYIDSAAQADAYRTEPRFQLQGSYRDMNKLAERIVSVMNDDELVALIQSHYENQAQTLTTGAEANLLKLLELTGRLHGDKAERWQDIKRTFQRNQVLGAVDQNDAAGKLIAQLALVSENLTQIGKAVDKGAKLMSQPATPSDFESSLQASTLAELGNTVAELTKLNQTFLTLQSIAERFAASTEAPGNQRIQIINRIPRAFLDVIKHQFDILERWIDPLQALSKTLPAGAAVLKNAKISRETYRQIVAQLESRVADDADEVIVEPEK